LAYALLNLGEWAAQRNERSGEGWDSGGPPRNARRRAAALVAPLLALVAAGCFSDPINHPPSVSIEGPNTPPPRQTPVTFHAQASDQDGDTTHLKWAYFADDCTSGLPSGMWDVQADEASYTVYGEKTNGPFCLWVMATDSHGATGNAHWATDPQDRAPTAAIDIVAPDPMTTNMGMMVYPLYSIFELAPRVSDPEGDMLDPPNLVFDHVAPGSAAVLKPCGPPNSGHECFIADVSGEYKVALTVTDSKKQQGMASQSLVVLPDQVPCITFPMTDFVNTPMLVVTLPLPTDPAPDSLPSYAIGVKDDGAPSPLGPNSAPQNMAKFSWSFSTDGGKSYDLVGGDFPSLSVTDLLPRKPGDIVKLRVEVRDGNADHDRALDGCDAGAEVSKDLCQTDPKVPGCYQRVTWSVEFR